MDENVEDLKDYIKNSSDFSVYTKISVAAFLDFALEAVEKEWKTKKCIIELRSNHLYRGYFYHDHISLPENASKILDICVPNKTFEELERELNHQLKKRCTGHLLKRWTPTATSGLLWKHILIPHSRGKSVLDAEQGDLEVLNEKRETIFDSIRNPCGEEISFNVILLLSNAWTIIYNALTKARVEAQPISRAVLYKAFMEAKFSEQYYESGDLVVPSSYCVDVHSFITASESFWAHQKELNPELEKKELNHELEKKEQHKRNLAQGKKEKGDQHLWRQVKDLA